MELESVVVEVGVVSSAWGCEFGEVGKSAVLKVDDVMSFGARPVLIAFRVDTSSVADGEG